MILQQDIPQGYAHCFAGKNNCPKANSCLRAISAKLLTESLEEQPQTINTVNAIYVERLPNRASCPLYRSSEPLRYAKGMTSIFDELPLKQAANVRRQVKAIFSCESYFYQSLNGSRLINLDEQRQIAHVFQSISPDLVPKFDGYKYVILW